MNLRILSSLLAFGLAVQAQTPVKLGVINGVTGIQAPIGEYISNGYKLATRDRVAAVVGPYSSACANAVSKLAEKYRVPLLVPVASKEDITRQNQNYVFRLSATTEDYATKKPLYPSKWKQWSSGQTVALSS